MKRIGALAKPTPGIADYLGCAGTGANWAEFRSHGSGAAYRELVAALQHVQHGLCAYCEIEITELDRQIEHVVPQSDQLDGAKLSLNYANLILCCKGGTLQTSDQTRRLDPVNRNGSCGEAKGNRVDTEFIDPRMLPALPSLTRVNFDGRIAADRDPCKAVGITVEKLKGRF